MGGYAGGILLFLLWRPDCGAAAQIPTPGGSLPLGGGPDRVCAAPAGREEIGPGVGAGAREAAWAAGRTFPRRPPELDAEGSGDLGAHPGPRERLDRAVGLGLETPECPEGEERSHVCY
ncbi:hypothetical protein NDU88_003317 [Pleurodeles waltl]|uniref:Uncharacterized protein n=1 Tax=Pleurodeles waltl TaxID=8319 RepID=A0AAV7MRW6_PLEWA|nr:hypothetical protein NDU88_003317 [Pleurodeles waltl]